MKNLIETTLKEHAVRWRMHDGSVEYRIGAENLQPLVDALEKLNGETLVSSELFCQCNGFVEVNKINDKWICTKCNRPLAK